MNKYVLLTAVAIALTACSTEENYIDEPIAAQFSASITQSRASNNTWDNGDNIGISMSGRYFNIRYTYTTEGNDGVFTGNTMYFKNKQEPVTITAYYPYTGNEGQTPDLIECSTTAVRQTPEEQTKFDFLYAVKENVTGAEPDVNLLFSHRMCKLTIDFLNGNIGTDVRRIVSCVISGLVLDGTFNTATGECAAKTEASATDLTLTPTVTYDDENKVRVALPSLLLFPQNVTKVTMKITDNEDQDYSCDLNFAGNRLEPGNNYLYTITVKKTELSVNQSIIDWITEPLSGEASSDDSDESDDESES